MSKLLLVLLERPQFLTESQLDKLADVFINLGTLFFGSMVIPHLIPGLDQPSFGVLLLGILVSFSCWLMAILFARRIKP